MPKADFGYDLKFKVVDLMVDNGFRVRDGLSGCLGLI